MQLNHVFVLVALCTISALCPAATRAGTFQIVLLDKNDQPLRTGDAIVVAHPESRAPVYAGFIPELGVYQVVFPAAGNVDLEVFTQFGTDSAWLYGFSGRRDQAVYLRADRIDGPKVVSYRVTVDGELNVSNAHKQLLDRLDTLFPGGVPENLTNIRGFVERKFAPISNLKVDELSPSSVELKGKTMVRVEKLMGPS